jgi:molecular chaperone DnaJ
MDHYESLGLTRTARAAEIKKAYRRLARKYHPDLNPGDARAEERFKRINEAYEVLGDAAKRKAYDRGGTREGPGPSAGPGPAGFAGAPPGVWEFDAGFDPGASGAFSSFISDLLRESAAGSAPHDGPRRGDDVTRTIRIGFFDSLRGLTTDMEIDAESPCGRCGGSGRVPSAARRPCVECAGTGRINRSPGPLRLTTLCRRCHGEGTLSWDGCGSCGGAGILVRRETIKVHIPAGVDVGSRVRVPGKGCAGHLGGPPGDLFIITQVEPHPFFKRMGDNIHCTVPITVPEAALGTRIEVPTIDGRASVRIPPGTETGQKFRLRGKGAPSLRGTGRGDQYVETRITTPRAENERMRQLLKEIGEAQSGEDLRRGLFG